MPANLTKRDIVLSIYDKTGFPQKEVREVVQLTLDTIASALSQGRNVELRNFGVFEVQVRKSRIGRNPNKAREGCGHPHARGDQVQGRQRTEGRTQEHRPQAGRSLGIAA
jgi:nucleoid DNA-binding protein